MGRNDEEGDRPGGRTADWGRRIQAIAQIGLTYTEGPYDRERYHELRTIAAEMLASAGGGDAAAVEDVLALEDGYATPKVDVRALAFRGEEVLLVREAADGLWTLPGGWADGGDTPAEAVVREVREETGFDARVVRLLAVYDRDRQGHPPLQWHVYKLFFLCELVGGTAATSLETTAVGFFPLDRLPPLSLGRVMPEQIVRLAARRGADDPRTLFD